MSEAGVRASVKVFGAVVAVLVIVGIAVLIKSPAARDPIRTPAVWYSNSETEWTHFPLDCEDDQHLVAVAASQGQLIAVGSGRDGGSVWSSEDGQVWQRTWNDAASEPHDVTAGGPGWVIVGGSWDSSIHTSADGVSWERVFNDSATVLNTVATLDSTLMVGGGYWVEGADLIAAIWTSDDAAEWSPTTLPGGEGSQVIALTSVGSGLLAAADTGVFWYSGDGRDWEEWQTTGLDPMSVQDVAGTGWLVAVGWNWDGSPGIWKSADGHDWQAVEASDDWAPYGVVSRVDGVLALGQLSECSASVLAVAEQGEVEDLSGDDPRWLSDECREGITLEEGECDDGAARIYDAVILDDGSIIAVGYW